MKPYQTFEIPTQRFIDQVNISTIMGFEDGAIPEPMDAVHDDMLKQATQLMRAKTEVKLIHGGEFTDRQLMIDGVTFQLEQTIFQMVKKASDVAFFICTLGPQIPAKIKALSEQGLHLEAYILDLIASDAVDLAMDLVQNQLKDQLAAEELNLTNRYSPGYCDWNVQDQKKLFRILPGHFTKVSLTESCVMHPMKTISGIIGIGKDVKFNPYNCEVCRRKDCVYSSRKMYSAA